MPEPVVSVVLAVYNGAVFLAETLDSLRAQTFGDYELLAVDDGSQDASWDILTAYAARDSRLRLLRCDRNRGHRAASNLGARAARGELIARHDQDDLSLPTRLEAQVRFLRDHPQVGLVGTGYWSWMPGREPQPRTAPQSHSAIRWRLLFDNVFCHSSLMLRRSALGGQPLARFAPATYDYEVCVRLGHRTQLAGLAEPLVVYRRHAEGMSAHQLAKMERGAAALSARQIRRLLPQRRLPREEIENLRRYSTPQRHGPGAFRCVPLMLQLFERFAAEPDIEPHEVSHIRRRWVRRMFAATPMSALGPLWRSGALRSLLRTAPWEVARFISVQLPQRAAHPLRRDRLAASGH